MSTADPHPATPENVAKLASVDADLPRIALLGIFGSDAAPMALVRERSGKIARVAIGDKISIGTVAAIGIDQLVLRRSNGATKTLRLPKG